MKNHVRIAAGLAALLTLVLAGIVVSPEDSSALPAFARKYRTSCSTCHVSFPKLNAFGEAYRLNGYQVPDGDDPFVKEEPVSLGSEAWKRVWPEGIWPSSIPGTGPIAVRATGAFVADLRGLGEPSSGSEDGKYGFLFPSALNLYAAGNLAEDMSLWFAAHLFQGDSWGALGKLHVTFTSLGDAWLPRQLFNLRIGQFVPAALAFDHHRNMTFSTPLAAVANTVDGVPFGIGHVHGSGSSHGGGGHDHGDGSAATVTGAYAMGDPQAGAELYGLLTRRIEYTLGAVNGSGTLLDDNNAKDLYGRVRVKFGGLAFDGTSAEAGQTEEGDEEPRLRDSGAWADNSVTLGAIGYWGQHVMQTSSVVRKPMIDSLGNVVVLDNGDAATVAETTTRSYDTDVLRAGADIVLNLGDFELLTMGVWGRDSDPHGLGVSVDTLLLMSQLDWVTPWPFLVASLRYETARFTAEEGHAPDNAQALVTSLTALVRANVRVQIEGHVDLLRDQPGQEVDYAAIILDVSF